MSGEMDSTIENQTGDIEVDPWAAAFAALDKKNQGDQERTEANAEGDNVDAEGDHEDSNPDNFTSSVSGDNEDDTGGSDNPDGVSSGEDDDDAQGVFGVTEEELTEYREGLQESVRDRAISDMAQEFIKRGIRNTNGRLGATINDPDICKRDSDGVPRFYNPETGNEFTGDNPRRQAQEWVDDYNKELAKAFNNACAQYSEKLMEEDQPQLQAMEFASTYSKLDPIRQAMLDAVIEDYEITNSEGKVIGYSCDLNQALRSVDRQVAVIKEYGKANAASVNENPNQPTGPALDMKNSASVANKPGEKPNFKSLAEAMEWEQDQLLAKMKEKK